MMDSKRNLILVAFVTGLALLLGGLPATAVIDTDGNRQVGGNVLNFGSAQWRQQMEQDGLVALYLFNETSGLVRDVSGFGEPLDLVIDQPDSRVQPVNRSPGRLEIRFPTLIHSNGPATKIIDQCKASNELTVQVWLENAASAELPRITPIRIVTLSNPRSTNRNELSSTNRNFYFGQDYDAGTLYRGAVRTSRSRNGGEIFNDLNVTKVRELQNVVMTRDAQGVARLFVSYRDDQGQNRLVLRRELASEQNFLGDFSNWDDRAVLGLGNEISYASGFESEDRAWLGILHAVAIFCKALSPQQILGDAAPPQPANRNLHLNPDFVPTENHRRAALLYRRLTGVTTPITSPLIDQMARELSSGDRMGWLRAARIATSQREFYNITVRDFAARMATREETVNAPLNDFVATIIGVVRDGENARQLLTGNFYYAADPDKAAVVDNMIEDHLMSNNHYLELERNRFNLAEVLVRRSPQSLYDGQGGVVPNPDPAGLLTTRGWMEAHAVAGTNRRLVEFAFRQFMCVEMEHWADAFGPDNMVGRDVDRFPGNEHDTYTTSCRSCHSVMDSMRPAFARFDFTNGFTKNAFVHAPGNGPNQMAQNPPGIAQKMNRNDDVFPGGFVIENDGWVNHAVRGANAAFFGWRSENQRGYGIRDFGQLLASSEAFPRCMAQRAFRSVCKREIAPFERGMINQVAKEFEENGYDLRLLFEMVAVTKECMGN